MTQKTITLREDRRLTKAVCLTLSLSEDLRLIESGAVPLDVHRKFIVVSHSPPWRDPRVSSSTVFIDQWIEIYKDDSPQYATVLTVWYILCRISSSQELVS